MTEQPHMPDSREEDPTSQPDEPLRVSEFIERRGYVEVVIVAIAILAFAGVTAFGFVYDDRAIVLQNPALRSWHSAFASFNTDIWSQLDPTIARNYYRPLLLLLMRLCYALFGTEPAGWHAVNVVLHAASSLLVFLFAARQSRDRLTGAVAGLLFAVHPIHIEPVAWVSGMVDPELTVLVLACLLFFQRWIAVRSKLALAASALLFLAALLTKEPAITLLGVLPLMILLRDRSESIAARLRQTAVSMLPFLAVLAVYSAARIHALGRFGNSVASVGWAQSLLNVPHATGFYLKHLVWPAGLSIVYDIPAITSPTLGGFWMPVIVILLLIAATCCWAWRSREDRCTIAIGAALLVLPLLPVLNLRWFLNADFLHDRYAYLPSVGFCLLVALLLRNFLGDIQVLRISRLAPLLAVAALAVVSIYVQELPYANDRMLWKHITQVAPGNDQAWANLGIVEMERGNIDAGMDACRYVLARNPTFWPAAANLARGYFLQKDWPNAERALLQTIQLAPANANLYFELSAVELHLGNLAAAEKSIRRAIELWPNAEDFHSGLGAVLLTKGDRTGAREAFQQELQLYPGSASARNGMAQLDSLR